MGQFSPAVNCDTNRGAPACLTGKKALPTSEAAEGIKGYTCKTAVEVEPKTSSERQSHKNNPFTITNGHYVGHDGFVVPKDFKELYGRFPDRVGSWVSKHADSSATKEDLEDWTNDLLLYLCHVSAESKHLKTGKTDIVQTFDPAKRGGANEARFWDYINHCLKNRFSTIRSKRMKDALCRPGNLSLRTQAEEEDAGSVGGEYCHSHSAHLQDAARVAEKQADDLARIQEFKNFVLREDAKVLPVIEALLATGRYADAADRARLTNSEFTWMLTRLKKLGTCFLNGEPVPRRRRPYKRRIAKITIVSDSRFAALKA